MGMYIAIYLTAFTAKVVHEGRYNRPALCDEATAATCLCGNAGGLT